MKILKIPLRIITLVTVFFTLVAYVSSWTRPQTMAYVQFVGMAYPWLFLCNLILIAIWLRLKNRYWIIPLATILIGWSHFVRFVGFSIFDGNSNGVPIKVMTYNIDNFSYCIDKDMPAAHTQAFEDFIRKENPDVLCLQEAFITSAEYQTRLKRFPTLVSYPYYYHPAERAMVIFSKYPAVQFDKIMLAEQKNETANGAIYADLNVNGKIVRLINTHLQSNSIRVTADAVLNRQTLRDEGKQKATRNMFSRIARMSYLRAQQAEGLRAFIKTSPYPIIVAGDFNDTPQSYTYAQVSDGLQDAFAKRGLGLGVTYDRKIPGLRIDYILTSPKFDIISHRIWSKPFSDHYAVMAKIGIK